MSRSHYLLSLYGQKAEQTQSHLAQTLSSFLFAAILLSHFTDVYSKWILIGIHLLSKNANKCIIDETLPTSPLVCSTVKQL